MPQPAITVYKYTLKRGDVVVVEVFPSLFPPVRFKGRIWIRTGATKAIANETEERILIEKRTSSAKTFDALPALGSNIEDLDKEIIKNEYLPLSISPDILEQNHRNLNQQLASIRLYDLVYQLPTYAGILMFGKNPQYYLPGAYIQNVKFDGNEMAPNPKEKVFNGSLIKELKIISDFINYNIIEERPIRGNSLQETKLYNYPFWAIRELILNAIMHRNYESNAPIYIYHYKNRIEIINSGGVWCCKTRKLSRF